jgi:hypothetical protein
VLASRRNAGREETANVTREFAAVAAGLTFADLPQALQERTPRLILDLAGNMLRARHEAESTPAL